MWMVPTHAAADMCFAVRRGEVQQSGISLPATNGLNGTGDVQERSGS